MTQNRLEPVLRHVRSLGGEPAADLPDAVLLARFSAGGDEAAFAVLVRRHGPMVLGLCRRLLADHHSAEDAFQATFLLLSRKARRLRRPERLGPWLYGVARRVALKARSAATRRREVAAADVPAPEPPEAHDLRPVIDAAIAGLPARYRTPVVLCYLQGLTYAEAAERLRCPPGTVATRLSRARDRLRVLLLRQGIAPAAGALTAALTPDATAALVPDELVRSTARWAAALAAGSAAAIPAPILTLTREVAQAMIFDKLKVLAVLVVLGVAGAGAGVALSRPAGAESQDKPGVPAANADAAPDVGRAGRRTLPVALLRQKPPEQYLLDAGDIVGVFIEGVLGERGATVPIVNFPFLTGPAPAPALGYPFLVQDDGTLALPLIKPISARGKTITEMRDLIAKEYFSNQLIAPGARVLISLGRTRTYRVTVVRSFDPTDLTSVTSLDLPAYENDILTALARSGGLPSVSGPIEFVIERGAAGAGATAEAVAGGIRRIRIPLHVRWDQPLPFKPDDVILRNGDVLTFAANAEMPASTAAPEGGSSAPSTTQPKQVAVSLAVAAPDGRILMQLPSGAWKMFDTANVKASETDGRPVAAVAERLKTMTAVLIATSGKPPTPQQMQLAKPGTLVLIIKD